MLTYCKDQERREKSRCRGCEYSINPYTENGTCLLSLSPGERMKARLERLKIITEHGKRTENGKK